MEESKVLTSKFHNSIIDLYIKTHESGGIFFLSFGYGLAFGEGELNWVGSRYRH